MSKINQQGNALNNDLEAGWYGEWVFYENDYDKELAYIYLKLWKRFFMSKSTDLTLKNEAIIDKPHLIGKNIGTLAIKFEMVEQIGAS